VPAVSRLHSEGDNTLKIAFRIGDAPEFDRALGFKGPQHPVIVERECPDVFVVDCKNVVHSHGGYRTAPAYYEPSCVRSRCRASKP
jgi:hypothetical protein